MPIASVLGLPERAKAIQAPCTCWLRRRAALLLPVSDALLMGKLVDAVVYVIKAESTTAQQARTGLNQFERAQIPVIGVVLNQINPGRLASYGEYGGGYVISGYAEGRG